MTTLNGLPAHVLLVHFVVVLAPLTAVLAILCALWPAARRRLVWLVAVLAVAVTALTPLTAEAGEWLEDRVDKTAALETHEDLGKTMLYFAIALLVAAVLLVIAHRRDTRNTEGKPVVSVLIAVLVIAISAGTIVQVMRIGESGARSAWADAVSAPENKD